MFPQFLELLGFISDPFWNAVFTDLAYGITPYGIYMDAKRKILLSTRKKDSNLFFGEITDPELLFVHLIQFLRANGTLSLRDFVAQKNKIKETFQQNVSWKAIKKKNIRIFLLEHFTIRIREKYNMTKAQMRLLYKRLLTWFQFKLLQPNDIIFSAKKGVIIGINGIYIDKKKNFKLVPKDP